MLRRGAHVAVAFVSKNERKIETREIKFININIH